MHDNRRTFLKTLGIGAAAAAFGSFSAPGTQSIKPPRLKIGDTIGLANPAGATYDPGDIDIVRESLAALGLKCTAGRHLLDRYGYFAGSDANRAEDINTLFNDPGINAILTVRGGWGCNRILPALDYDRIRRNPKIIVGYSDVTSLLVGIHARTGLVTFHGPVGTSTWNQYSVDYFKRILFDGEAVLLSNPRTLGDNLAQTRDRVETIVPGTARGRLIGGNLSVLSAMMGSGYLPDWQGTVLFLEDDAERISRVDRMLTQLSLSGVLAKAAAVVFGKCTNCTPGGEGYGSLTLQDVLADHLKPLGVPSWYGAMIGHIENKFTVPVGVEAEVDSVAGTIRLLEPAVS